MNPDPVGKSSPVWARLVVGAIVGVLAVTLTALLTLAIALPVSMAWGRQTWPAALRVIGFQYALGVPYAALWWTWRTRPGRRDPGPAPPQAGS